ncbi:MAG TPA: DUF1552 domain-containing protein [Polyangiaceae bacterium]|jgi:hypothetical protein|nr:DUF1552 domain-containing protein [Polyangiaceae bacterium]
MNNLINRRTVLRGAGVALTLPWLASLAPRAARAAGTTSPKRFLPIFFPNGSADYWEPATTGQGAAWSLSPILQPFQALKSKMVVITNMENYTPFKVLAGVATLNPSHGQCPGAFLACVDANVVRAQLNTQEANGITADQVLAQSPAYATLTAKQSMQVGLSTVYSYCDGKDCSVSRSISWKSATEPMYKDVDPGTIFDEIVGASGKSAGGTSTPDPDAAKAKAAGKSVLDAVLENANRTRAKLGTADQMKLDEFLSSVRTVETSVTSTSTAIAAAGCTIGTRPTMAAAPQGIPDNVPGGYSKETHANLMNDLIVMAFQCDVTRVISYMLEDERSEFIYSHVPLRNFTAAGSTPASGTQVCGNYHGAQHAGNTNDDFSTISWWNSSKVAALATRLDAIQDGEGASILDNTVIMYSAAMHGGNHQSNQLPLALIGGGGGTLKLDQHVKYGDTPGDRPMRDLYYTLLNKTFGMNVASFGTHIQNIPNSYMTEILNG